MPFKQNNNEEFSKNKEFRNNEKNNLIEQINPSKNIDRNNIFQFSIIAKPPKDIRDLSYNYFQLQ